MQKRHSPRYFKAMKPASRLDERFERAVLDNGVRLLVEPISHVKSVSVGFWIVAGARNENRRSNGISHLTEHCVFKGTGSRSAYQLVKSLESVGGSINAFTSREVTCYYAHVLDEHLEIAVDVLSDLVSDPKFREKDLEKEKNVILDEIRDSDDTPDELIYDAFWQDLFPGHPVGFNILGSSDNLNRFRRDDLVDYHAQYYVPSNIVVAVSGNVDTERVRNAVSKYLSGNADSSGRLPPRPKKVSAKRSREAYHVVEKPNLNQTHVFMGYRGLSYNDPDKFDLLGLNLLYGGGMSSRLFRNIRERYGITYSIYSFTDFLFDTGAFGVYAATDKRNHKKAINLIRQELEKLGQKKIGKTELKMVKAQLKAGLLYGLESTSNRMIRTAKNEIYLKRAVSTEEVINRIEGITAENILSLTNRFLEEEQEQVTILMSA